MHHELQHLVGFRSHEQHEVVPQENVFHDAPRVTLHTLVRQRVRTAGTHLVIRQRRVACLIPRRHGNGVGGVRQSPDDARGGVRIQHGIVQVTVRLAMDQYRLPVRVQFILPRNNQPIPTAQHLHGSAFRQVTHRPVPHVILVRVFQILAARQKQHCQ